MPTNEISILAVLKDKFSRPLQKMGSGLTNVSARAKKLNTALAPLTGSFASLAVSVLSIQGAREAIDTAEKQAQSEQEVLSALEGQVKAKDRLLEVSNHIQNTTIFGDEDLLQQEAIMLRLGVAADRIPDAIQASVDTAAALGLSLSLVVRGIGRGITTGDAGLLTKRVKALNDLRNEGTLATGILKALNDQFGGAAVDQASTSFGRRTQELNTFGDSMEVLGAIFVEFLIPALVVINEHFHGIVDLVKGDAAQVVFRIIKEVTPAFVKFGLIFSSVIGGLVSIKAFGFVLGAISGVATAILGTVFSFATALGGIPTLVLLILKHFHDLDKDLTGVAGTVKSITGAFGDAGKSVIDVGTGIARAFALVKDGERSANRLDEIIQSHLKAFGSSLVAFVAQPLENIFDALSKAIGGLFDNIRFNFEALGRIVLNLSQKIVGNVAGVVAEFIDSLPASLKESLAGLTGIPTAVFSKVLRGLGDQDVKIIDDKIEDLISKGEDGTERLKTSFDGVSKNISSNIEKAKRDFANATGSLEDFLTAADPAFQAQRLLAARANQSGISSAIKELISSTAELDAELAHSKLNATTLFDDLSPEKIKDLLTTFDASTAESVKAALAIHIEGQFAAQLISVKDFLDQKNSLETTKNTNQLDGVEQVLASRLAELGVLRESLVVAEQQTIVSRKLLDDGVRRKDSSIDILDLQAGLTDKMVDEEDIQFRIRSGTKEIVETQREQNVLTAQRVVLEQQLEAGRVALGNQLIAEAEVAKTELQEARKELQAQISLGLPFTQALELENAAADRFEFIIERIVASMDDLIDASPEAQSQLEEVRLAILGLGGSLENLDTSSEGFWDGMKQGAKSTITDMSDLNKAGQNISSTMTQFFAKDLVRSLNDADYSFEEFANNFLQKLSEMIQELLIFKALSFALNFGSGGSDTGAGQGFVQGSGRFTGGAIFAEGGPVPGPNVNADIIPAMLTPDEYVVNQTSSRLLGHGFLGFLNNIKSASDLSRAGGLGGIMGAFRGGSAQVGRAHFATGGRVSSSPSPFGSSQESGAVIGTVTGSYQTMDQLLKGGGESAIFDLLGRNAELTRSVLGL